MAVRQSVSRRAGTVLVLAAAGAVTTPAARAIEQGTNSTNVPALANLAYVGRQQTEFSSVGDSRATGALIRTNIVLGAAHCVGTTAPGGSRFLADIQWEFGGTQFAAIGVVHPNYAGNVNYGANDIAYFVMLNGQNLAPAPANILATAAEEQAIVDKINGDPAKAIAGAPQDVTLVGNQRADNTVNPGGALAGLSRVKMVPAGGNANEWTFDAKLGAGGGYAGSNWINTGDSGGPTLAVINGNTRIIGVHSFRDGATPAAATVDVDTRISPYRDFVDGKGAAGSTTLTYYTGMALNGTYDWATAAKWNRTGAATPAALPAAGDVVVLDPTAGFDTAITLNVGNQPDPRLEGLVTDVTLKIGSAGNANQFSVTGESGTLNGGSIFVQNQATASFRYQFNNTLQGQLEADDKSTILIGNFIPATAPIVDATGQWSAETLAMYCKTASRFYIYSGSAGTVGSQTKSAGQIFVDGTGSVLNLGTRLPGTVTSETNAVSGAISAVRPTVSLFNQAGGLVKVTGGGAMNVSTQYLNNGETDISGADAGGAYATVSVGANLPATSGAVGGTDFPTALANYVDGGGAGLIKIDPGGRLRVTNGAATNTAQLYNAPSATITVTGEGDIVGNNAGSVYADVYANTGRINLSNAGQLSTGRVFQNFAGGRLNIDGGAAGFSYARTAILFNSASVAGDAGPIPPGVINMVRGRLDATRPDGLVEGPAAINAGAITMGDFTTLTVSGQFSNGPTGTLTVNTPAGGTAADLEFRKNDSYAAQGLVNQGKVSFGGAGPTARMYFGNSDFVTAGDGSVAGPVTMQYSLGTSSWSYQTGVNGSDLTEASFHFLGDGAAATPAKFEIMNVNQGQTFEGFDLALSVEDICVLSNSYVDLVDNFSNEEVLGTEVQYTYYLGVDSTSTLDLGGHTLYYALANPNCGLDTTRVINGTLIQVPEPSAVAALVAPAMALAGRCRRGR